jgi:hypothetical protein
MFAPTFRATFFFMHARETRVPGLSSDEGREAQNRLMASAQAEGASTLE